MIEDTNDLTWRDHALLLIAFALLLIAGLAGHVWTLPADHVPDAGRTIPATQEYYEQEKAGLHGLEDTDLETTAEKLDRVRRRDAADHRTP